MPAARPKRPGQPWGVGVSQADDALLVMLSLPHSQDMGWKGQYKGTCYVLIFIYFIEIIIESVVVLSYSREYFDRA